LSIDSAAAPPAKPPKLWSTRRYYPQIQRKTQKNWMSNPSGKSVSL
jgi:hypothetical protein